MARPKFGHIFVGVSPAPTTIIEVVNIIRGLLVASGFVQFFSENGDGARYTLASEASAAKHFFCNVGRAILMCNYIKTSFVFKCQQKRRAGGAGCLNTLSYNFSTYLMLCRLS